MRTTLVIAAALLLAACTSGPAAPTPTAQQTGALPTATPLETGPAATTPGGEAGAACNLISEAEMTAIIGETMTVTASDETSCTWSAASFLPSINIRTDTGEDIASAKLAFQIMEAQGQDVTVAGNPGFYGNLMGAILYVEKAGHTLVVQAPISSEDPIQQQVTQIAETILSRWP